MFFDYNSFVLGILLVLVILLPFVLFKFDSSQPKWKVTFYCIISWGLLYLLFHFYSKFSYFYSLRNSIQELSWLWVIVKEDEWESIDNKTEFWNIINEASQLKEIDTPLMFDLDPTWGLFIAIIITFLWWLCSLLYYLALKRLYNLKFVNKIKWNKLWKK